MSIKTLNQNLRQVHVRARIKGKVISRKKVIAGFKNDARKIEAALFDELALIKKNAAPDSRSLTLNLFGDVLKFWTERTSAKLKTLQHLIDRLHSELGNVRNEEIQERFGDFLDDLKSQRAREWMGEKARLLNLQRQQNGKKSIVRSLGGIIKPSTRNHYLAIAKMAYGFAVKRGKLKENPLKEYDKEKETPRDRVWSENEKETIFKVLSERKSHLYWPVYFSAMNPIRKGDLVALKRENFFFNRFNPSKSYIHFMPKKTGRYKPIESHLICIDKKLLDYFQGLPANCELLFPRFDADGHWHSLGCFKREWQAVLKEAGIKEKIEPDGKVIPKLTWHDLKHCSITWMLDNGFSELDLKNLGIQYSADMIARYYHKDAEKARGAWDRIQEKNGNVLPGCVTLSQKTA